LNIWTPLAMIDSVISSCEPSACMIRRPGDVSRYQKKSGDN